MRRRPPISKEADLRDSAAGAASCLGSQTGSQAASSHSNQSFAEHDLNMHLDRGFCAVFACWLQVCSAAEFWISIAWEIEPAGCRIQKVCCSIDQQLDFLNTRMDFGSSSQNVAKHDLNMQLDPGFRAVFACWMHVFSEAEFRISVHEKSNLLAAEFEKVC